MKYKVLIFCLTFLFVTSWIAASIEYTVSNTIGGVPNTIDADPGNLLSILGAYWNLVTFQIQGVPVFISVIFGVVNLISLWLLLTEVLIPIAAISPWTLLATAVLGLLTAAWFWIENTFPDVPQTIKDVWQEVTSWFDWGLW